MFYCKTQYIDYQYFNTYNKPNLKQNFKNLNQFEFELKTSGWN